MSQRRGLQIRMHRQKKAHLLRQGCQHVLEAGEHPIANKLEWRTDSPLGGVDRLQLVGVHALADTTGGHLSQGGDVLRC